MAQEAENIRLDKEAKKLGYADLLSYQNAMKKTGKALKTLLSSQRDDPPPPICIGPRWGNGECIDLPNIDISIGLKSWENIDKFDLTVDVLGIVGDMALKLGPTGAGFWFATEVVEFMGIGKSFDQMETDDPAGGVVSSMVDAAIPIAQWARLLPNGGWVANLAGIGLNVFEIEIKIDP